jgi:hypothetical protein
MDFLEMSVKTVGDAIVRSSERTFYIAAVEMPGAPSLEQAIDLNGDLLEMCHDSASQVAGSSHDLFAVIEHISSHALEILPGDSYSLLFVENMHALRVSVASPCFVPFACSRLFSLCICLCRHEGCGNGGGSRGEEVCGFWVGLHRQDGRTHPQGDQCGMWFPHHTDLDFDLDLDLELRT